MSQSLPSIYKKSPIGTLNDIPVFSNEDEYIKNYNKIASDHVSKISKDSDNPWISEAIWNEMEQSTLHLIQKYARQTNSNNGLKILDVGVGLGRLLKRVNSVIKDIKLESYGMDIAGPYLKIAKQKGHNVCLAKVDDMPYNSDMFHLIICTDVLEHVLDLNKSIHKIVDVLKPGGYLIVRVPYREDLSAYLRDDYPYYLAHLRSFDESSLELLFNRIFNLKVLEFSSGLIRPSKSLRKHNIPLKGYNFFLMKVLRITKFVAKGLYDKMVKQMYYPTEINIVIQKPLFEKDV